MMSPREAGDAPQPAIAGESIQPGARALGICKINDQPAKQATAEYTVFTQTIVAWNRCTRVVEIESNRRLLISVVPVLHEIRIAKMAREAAQTGVLDRGA
ncbi:MAG TPA: hypothetical protein VIV66_16460 [Pyrinomonadaceae bacterium]